MRLSHFVLGGLAFASFPTLAGGLYLSQIGTDDVGLSAAGVAARAQDPSVMYMNPAGIARLEGRNATVAGEGIYGDANYELDNSALGDTGNTIGFLPSASMFYSQQLNDKWSVGVGLYGMFGLGLDFGNWASNNPIPGSDVVESALLQALTLQSTVSYRVNDKLSFGAALGINYGIFEIERNGQDSDDSDVALNYRVGALYELNEGTRFGLGYTSKTSYDFDVDTPVLGQSLDLSATANAPQNVMFSAFHELNDSWAIMGNLGWQDWSKYSNADISVAGIDTPRNDRLQDTYSVAFGVQHQYSDRLTLNSGIGYETSLYKSQDNTSLTMPSGAAITVGVGMKYKVNETQSFGLALQYMGMESTSVDSNLGLSGRYEDPALWFIAFNYSWNNF